MFRPLYTGSMPTQMPPRAPTREFSQITRVLPGGSLLDGHVPGKWWKICLRDSAILCLNNKNLHCFRTWLRTPTRAAKYQVNSLRSFITSSLAYMRLVIHKKRCSHALEQTNAPGVGFICASSALLFLLAKVQLSTLFPIGLSLIHLAASLYLCPADCFQDILFEQWGTARSNKLGFLKHIKRHICSVGTWKYLTWCQ